MLVTQHLISPGVARNLLVLSSKHLVKGQSCDSSMCKLSHAPSDPPGVARTLLVLSSKHLERGRCASHATSDLARCGSELADSELQAPGKGTELRFVYVQTFFFRTPSDPPGVARTLLVPSSKHLERDRCVSHATSDLARCGSELASSER